MKRPSILLIPAVCTLLVAACGGTPPQPTTSTARPAVALSPVQPVSEETHLADVKQITLAGENAEAYWSWSGRELILQSRTGDKDCDRIFRMPLASIFDLP